ncbi:MAG TPA: DinB family protein [Cryomorphaceae bacterium]|nr:DinB family protein [Cryomorphaceae bacterium]
MKLDSRKLLLELDFELKTLIEKSSKIQMEPEATLGENPANGGWSVLECYDHLNRYSAYYIPEIKKSIDRAKESNSTTYKTGLLGNYSAKQMLPKEGKVKNKMNTFKSKNPSITTTALDKSVLEHFIYDQKILRKLLKQAGKVDLGKTKVKTTFPLISFKLGDILRFHINHELRHMLQIERTLNAVKATEVTA